MDLEVTAEPAPILAPVRKHERWKGESAMPLMLVVLDLAVVCDTTGPESRHDLDAPFAPDVALTRAWHGNGSLHWLAQAKRWTRVRPGALTLLRTLVRIPAEIHIVSTHPLSHIAEVAAVVDPQRALIGELHSVSDPTLDNIGLGEEVHRNAVILDTERRGSWGSGAAVVEPERYVYFPKTAEMLGHKSGVCYLERRRDEDEKLGILNIMGQLLQRIAQELARPPPALLPTHHSPSARDILRQQQRKILLGARILFSAVVARGTKAEDHPLFKLATKLGAEIEAFQGPAVTHVVAGSPGTDKTLWGVQNRKHVVSVAWVEASARLWGWQPERHFAIM